MVNVTCAVVSLTYLKTARPVASAKRPVPPATRSVLCGFVCRILPST